MTSLRRLLCLLVLAAPAHLLAQNYTSIVIFGDSLSDTGNVAHLTVAKYGIPVPGPVPSNYTLGRFTDGKDTVPSATLYTGVWIEQIAATLANKPPIINSLDGGTNYAYGYATTGAGSSVLDLTTGVSVNVENIGQQITDYLATSPTITNKTLFVVWGGAIDLLHATSPADIPIAAANEMAAIQTLIAKGATDFLIPNLPPLGLIPRNNTNTSTSTTANAASAAFNQALAAGLASLPSANPGKTLHIVPLDVYTLFTTAVANPTASGLANVTGSSQGNAVNPDTFLFWDDLHPTTAGHHLIALAAAANLATGFSTTTSLVPSPTLLGAGNPLTLTATVTSPAGQPTGSVTFLDGTTSLGTATLAPGATSTTATFTTSALTSVGTHPLTAMYTGAGGFTPSTSTTVNLTVVTAALTIGGSSNLQIPNGSSSTTSTYTLTSVGNFTTSATIACGTQPAHFVCSVTPSSLDLSDGAAHSFTATISVSSTAALDLPQRPGTRLASAILSAALLPLFGGLAFLRRRTRSPLPTLLLLLLSAGAALGLAGCSDSGSSANVVPSGDYTIPLTITPTGKPAVTYNITVTYHPFL